MCMHIVYVTREYPPSKRGGGIATYVKEIAEQMVLAGHQVTVIAASDDTRTQSDEMDNGIRIIRLKGGDFVIRGVEKTSLYHRFRFAYRYYSYRKAIVNTIRSLHDVDVIEVADYGSEGLYFDHLDIPYTVRLHMQSLFDLETQTKKKLTLKNAIFYYFWKQEEKVIKRCKYITSCSKALAEWSIKNYKLDANHVTVINNPVNQKNISSLEVSHLLDKNKRNIVYVGTVCATKGCKELVSASIQLKQKYPNLELWLFGKVGLWADSLAEENKSNPWIHFYGKIDRKLLYSIYKDSDVVCLPSWFDNFPMTCIEAMLAGAVVVGSKAGGMSEILQDGKTGFLVSPKDVSELTEKLDSVLAMSNESLNRLSKEARDIALNRYAPSTIGNQLEHYYKKMRDESTIL